MVQVESDRVLWFSDRVVAKSPAGERTAGQLPDKKEKKP